jgi:hypothetical protein
MIHSRLATVEPSTRVASVGPWPGSNAALSIGGPIGMRRSSSGAARTTPPRCRTFPKFPHITVSMITKDFHYTKDFPLIRGKSFVITGPGTMPRGFFRHSWHASGPGAAIHLPSTGGRVSPGPAGRK